MATLYKYGLSLATALGLLLAVSCTKEDNSDCPPPGVALRCSYTLNEDYTCHFKEEVRYVDFFVYDAAGSLCLTQRVETAVMQQGEPYGMVATLQLEAGTYTVAAWAHLTEEHHALYEPASFPTAVLATLFDQNGEYRVIRREMPHIFHSMTTVEVPMSRIASASMDFTKNTNDIHVILDSPGAPEDYEFFLASSNGYYRFDNTPADEADPQVLWYVPEDANQDLSNLQSTLSRTPRAGLGAQNIIRTQGLYIGDDTRLVIRLKASQTVLYDRSLTEMISQNPDIGTDEDLARYGHYELRFKTDKVDAPPILIEVNGWDKVDQNHPLG